MTITDAEFDAIRRPRSRWSELIARLKAGEKIVPVRVPKRENDSAGRQRIRHQIHAYAGFRGIRVEVRSKGKSHLFVRIAQEN